MTEMKDFPTLSPRTSETLPFRIPYEAWKRYPFRAEPPRLGGILPNPLPPRGATQFPLESE